MQYQSSREYIKPYVMSLVGTPYSLDTARRRDHSSMFMPIIQVVIPILFEDFSLPVARYAKLTSCPDMCLMISHLVLLLVRDSPYKVSSIIPLAPMKTSAASFLFAPSADAGDTSDSRKDPFFGTVVGMVEEWLRSYSCSFSWSDPTTALESFYVTVEALDDERMVHLRIELSFVILDAIITQLSRYDDGKNELDSTYCELIGLGLHVLKYIPVGAPVPSEPDDEYIIDDNGEDKKSIALSNSDTAIGAYLSRIFDFISRLSLDLDVVKTRLCAGLAIIALCADKSLPADSRRVQVLLDSPAIRACLLHSSTDCTSRQRLGTALCSVVNKLLVKFGECDSISASNDSRQRVLGSAIFVFKAYLKSLNWSVHGMQGESCQLSFVEMARLLAIILTNQEIASKYPIISNEFLSTIDEVILLTCSEADILLIK